MSPKRNATADPLAAQTQMAKRWLGRPPANLRQVFGILYLRRPAANGVCCLLPLAVQTVYGYFNRWQKQGVFERVQQVLTRREPRYGKAASLPHQQAALTAKVSRQQHKENQRVTMQKDQWTQTPSPCRYPRPGNQCLCLACQSPRS